MKLWRYLLRVFLRWVLIVFAVLTTVILLFMMVDNLGRYSDKGAALTDTIGITILQAPEILYQAFPLVLLLASLLSFLMLARSSELVVMRAAGISGLRLIAVPVLSSLAIGLAFVTAVNPLVASTLRRAEILEAKFGGDGPSLLSFSGEGLWLRQADHPTGETVIQSARSNTNGTMLRQVRLHRFDEEGQLYSRVDANGARLGAGSWKLDNATVWLLDAKGGFKKTEGGVELELPTDLDSAQILDSFSPPEMIGFWELRRFIEQMEVSGFSGLRHRIFYFSEVAKPALFAAMVMIGSAFALRPARFGQTGIMILLAIMAGFSLYFLMDFSETLGAQGEVPVQIAVWTPPAAAILLALGLLLHLEDG